MQPFIGHVQYYLRLVMPQAEGTCTCGQCARFMKYNPLSRTCTSLSLRPLAQAWRWQTLIPITVYSAMVAPRTLSGASARDKNHQMQLILAR